MLIRVPPGVRLGRPAGGGLSSWSSVPVIVGAVLALSGNIAGYSWIAAGILCTLAFALYNAWILLIEILR